MEEKEIEKAIKLCSEVKDIKCNKNGCPYRNVDNCFHSLMKDTVEYMKRLKTESKKSQTKQDKKNKPTVKTVELKDLKCGNTFKYKGYEFTKLADEDNSCYCLLNNALFESKFGKTNDWSVSEVRELLNEIDGKGNIKVFPKINIEDLVEVSLNYYSYNNPNGRVTDRITLLSWEEWYTYFYNSDFNIKDYESWLRSGHYGNAHLALSVLSGGSSYAYSVSDLRAVRPALHLKSNIKI